MPLKAESLGWTEERSTGSLPTYKSHGKTIGWIDWDNDALYIDNGLGYETIAAKAKTSFTKLTLIKRLKEGGHLTSIYNNDQRNTIKKTLGGAVKTVLALSASAVLETQEIPNGDDQLN